MASAFVLGGTGFVGSHILSTLITSPLISKVELIARRNPTIEATTKVTSVVDTDLSKWPQHVRTIEPTPEIFFNSFGTTRGAVGGFENQYKIEHDLNLEVVKAAKESGTKILVLISSNGANSKSRMGYPRMKGEIEEAIKEMGFDHTIILRPGLIAGQRSESRPAEAIFRKVADFAGAIHSSLKNAWAQDADVIAKAAVSAGLKVHSGEVKEKVWLIEQSDIIRLGLTEWGSQ